ncbi:hypothetical protein Fmac_004610 [Flemingia macrophylla]|uniref:Transmembrane protein n=1 Tax=Flemingia macrophylla TaxID=520843 RepID=A0ABD1N817_9FABA
MVLEEISKCIECSKREGTIRDSKTTHKKKDKSTKILCLIIRCNRFCLGLDSFMFVVVVIFGFVLAIL